MSFVLINPFLSSVFCILSKEFWPLSDMFCVLANVFRVSDFVFQYKLFRITSMHFGNGWQFLPTLAMGGNFCRFLPYQIKFETCFIFFLLVRDK